MILTGSVLKKIATDLTPDRADILADISNALCVKYGINDANVYHEFIANIIHESDQFRVKKENLVYTSPERLVTVWPSRFTMDGIPGKLNAQEYVRNPAKLAEVVYGGRMGNLQKGDAYAFLGGGFAQITGRDAYTAYAKYVNSKQNGSWTIQELARLIQTDDAWAFDSAFWFFCEFKNLDELALQDKFTELVKRWNGGFFGLPERERYYALAKKYIIN